ncbi:MAG TPA: hypothetical protein VHH36_01115, partial [Candidatus Thermoplasmatota archaeon]|nr:hypothetical protein [Candidatus Thermoplasmatota archaeon]
ATAQTTEPSRAPRVTFDGLLPSRAYGYELRVADLAGNVALVTGVASTKADTIAPGAPALLTVTDLLNGTLRLSWGAARDDVGVAAYRVYRAQAGGNLTLVAETSDLSYEDAGLPLEREMGYQVIAVDHAGNEGPATARAKATATAVPRLTGGAASPTVGSSATVFRYSITYASPGGVAPTSVRLILDGVAVNMTRQETGDLVAGVTYVYETRLAPHKRDDPHTYAFEASDGRYSVRFPEDGSLLRGPLVSGDALAAAEEDGFAAFAQRVPVGGAAGVALALAAAAAIAAVVVRRKKEGSK